VERKQRKVMEKGGLISFFVGVFLSLKKGRKGFGIKK
jgi:hypothetical protein